ncbi:MAG: hypothetical protein J7K85_08570 [Anaerolineaceae bacterium]|nr:hypothetical protein [Anaerolineaceae bacterium]
MNKKQSTFAKGIKFGLTYGIVLVILNLIAFTVAVGRIIFDTRSLVPVEYALVLLLFGFIFGMMSAAQKNLADDHMKTIFKATISTGLSSGGLMALFAVGAYMLQNNEMDPRTYLVMLSPDILETYLFESSLGVAMLLNLVLLVSGSVLGGLFLKKVIRADWHKNIAEQGKGKVAEWMKAPVIEKFRNSKHSNLVIILVAIGLLFLMPFVWGGYWNYVMGTVGIYILLGLGMNLIVGLSGQLLLGYVAFFAIGAYTMGLLSAPMPLGIELGFWPALLGSIIAAGLTGILLGVPILNLRGDYLAIVTLGFGEIIRILVKSDTLTALTGGPKGLRNIAKPTLFGMDFSSDVNFMHLIIVGVIVGVFIAYRLQYSRAGRAWLSIQGDETVARATGVNTYYYKILALAIGAAFAGVGGAIFASRNQFTGPEDHIMMVSINVLCLVIVGGMGSLPGVFLGAFVIKGIPELLREITEYRLMVFGILLVVMMIVRPEGLWPTRRPNLEEDHVGKLKKPTETELPSKEVAA